MFHNRSSNDGKYIFEIFNFWWISEHLFPMVNFAHKISFFATYSEQNRLSAKKSRAKKKQKVQTMNKLLANLKEENKKLREYVDEKLGKAEVQTLLVQKRAEAKKQESKLATQNFVAALRNPANRILDIDMMDFLDQLRQDFISGQRS